MDQMVIDAWRGDPEVGQDQMPDPIAEVGGVLVGAVITPLDVVSAEPGHDVFPTPRQERPDDPPVGLGLDSGQRPQPRAAQQLEQNPLGNVVPVVGGGDQHRPDGRWPGPGGLCTDDDATKPRGRPRASVRC